MIYKKNNYSFIRSKKKLKMELFLNYKSYYSLFLQTIDKSLLYRDI